MGERRAQLDGSAPAELPDGFGPSDTDLVGRARAGDLTAWEGLYRRHAPAGLRLSRQLSRDDAAAEDLMTDAFMSVMRSTGRGSGPETSFRAYLLTAIRRHSEARARRERPLVLVAEHAERALPHPTPAGETTRLHRALASLPRRWQLVLWLTAVEGQPMVAVGDLLGMSPNAASALAFRARAGLRRAYFARPPYD